MDCRLQKLIQDYIEGKISVEKFTNDFTIIYGQETEYEALGERRNLLFSEFSDFASRYSSSQEEIEEYKVHYGEDVIKEKAKELWRSLHE
jgi:hypothetical protein